MNVCLITCSKNEDEHIEEFLDHYFNIIGVDHIYWIDNNYAPLKPVEINDERVTIIDKTYMNFDDGEKDPLFHMRDVLNETYQKYIVGKYDWCVYCDVDELLDLNNANIKDYLQNKKSDMLCINWVLHGNNNYIWEKELPSNKMKENYGWDYNWKFTRVEYKIIFKPKPEFYMDIFFTKPKGCMQNCNDIEIIPISEAKFHHYRVQCIETYLKHKILNGFYGLSNRGNWCRNFFDSSQFNTSNVIIRPDKIESFKNLLIEYGFNYGLSDKDRNYLFKCYNINFDD